MHIEAFTSAKNPAAPASNEDRLVIYNDRVFGVIDGATDKSGVRLGGLTGGQLAGLVIETALRGIADAGNPMTIPARQILDRIDAEFQRCYRAHGLTDTVTADPNRRFTAQLALALTDGRALRLLQVGDCGIRINGTTTHWTPHPADAILAAVRSALYHHLERSGVDPETRLTTARAYTVAGLADFLPDHALTRTAWRRLRRELSASLPSEFPELAPERVHQAAAIGLRGIAAFRNRPEPLGYGCLDGFPVPDAFVALHELSLERVHTVEIFSDGYFGLPAGSALRDWEAHIAAVERDDPAKVGRTPSTKGSSPGRFSDDRTILILRKDPPRHAHA